MNKCINKGDEWEEYKFSPFQRGKTWWKFLRRSLEGRPGYRVSENLVGNAGKRPLSLNESTIL